MSSADVESAIAERPQAHVFVGNMTYQTRESELKDCVEKLVGKTSDVHIVFRGPRSQGFGFITFESEASIDKAIDLLKGYELDGRKLNVERCTPRSERPPLRRERRFSRDNNGRRERKPRGPPSETMIFVSNLPFRMTTEELQTLLNGYNVTNCRVVCRRNGSSRGYGFVEAADHDEQLRIINEFNNCECDNRSLHFRAATSEGPHGEQPDDE